MALRLPLEVDMELNQIREDVPLFPGTVNPDAVNPNSGAQHGFGAPNGAKPKWSGQFPGIGTRVTFRIYPGLPKPC